MRSYHETSCRLDSCDLVYPHQVPMAHAINLVSAVSAEQVEAYMRRVVRQGATGDIVSAAYQTMRADLLGPVAGVGDEVPGIIIGPDEEEEGERNSGEVDRRKELITTAWVWLRHCMDWAVLHPDDKCLKDLGEKDKERMRKWRGAMDGQVTFISLRTFTVPGHRQRDAAGTRRAPGGTLDDGYIMFQNQKGRHKFGSQKKVAHDLLHEIGHVAEGNYPPTSESDKRHYDLVEHPDHSTKANRLWNALLRCCPQWDWPGVGEDGGGSDSSEGKRGGGDGGEGSSGQGPERQQSGSHADRVMNEGRFKPGGHEVPMQPAQLRGKPRVPPALVYPHNVLRGDARSFGLVGVPRPDGVGGFGVPRRSVR